jgi:hypothetical protein
VLPGVGRGLGFCAGPRSTQIALFLGCLVTVIGVLRAKFAGQMDFGKASGMVKRR